MPKIVMETDGTREGTKLTIDGKEVADVASISMYGYLDTSVCKCGCCSYCCRPVSFSYSTTKKNEDGFCQRTSFDLDMSTASFKEKELLVDEKNPTRNDFTNL